MNGLDSLVALYDYVQQKRSLLFELAQANRAWRRRLLFATGVIGALSALATVAVFTEVFGGSVIKIITSMCIFVTACITAYMNFYVSTSDTDKMFEGAAEFLALREKIDYALGEKSSEDQRKKALNKFKTEYVALSRTYDRYFPPGSWDTAVAPSGAYGSSQGLTEAGTSL
ncbi:MAG TPA: hypothetical protein VI256_16425 [Roseiarcus sp.]